MNYFHKHWSVQLCCSDPRGDFPLTTWPKLRIKRMIITTNQFKYIIHLGANFALGNIIKRLNEKWTIHITTPSNYIPYFEVGCPLATIIKHYMSHEQFSKQICSIMLVTFKLRYEVDQMIQHYMSTVPF